MRKLILEVQMSMDGFIADQNGHTNWMIWNWGPEWNWDIELQSFHTKLNTSIDTVLLSKQMAEEGFIAHWAAVAENKNDPQYHFAKHVTDTKKIVFSQTLHKSTPIPGGWNNTEIAKDIDYITQLKQEEGRDMIVYGGATFVSSLLKAQLIDDLYLLVNPVVLGAGLSIFNSLSHTSFTLVNAVPYSCGVVLLHYRLK